MKKNNKGFMLLETLIVSTFILGTFVFLYVEFSAIKRSYDISFRYNTISGLYYAKEMANFLKEDGYNQIDSKLSDNNYVDITSCINSSSLCKKIVEKIDAKRIIYVGDNIKSLKKELNTNYDTNTFDNEFKQFILQLSDDTTGRNRIIIEYNNSTFATITLSDNNKTEYKMINLIKNSNFENGTENWYFTGDDTNFNVSTNKYSGNYSGNFSATRGYIYQTTSLIKNHIYYASEQIYLTETPVLNSEFDLFLVGETGSSYNKYGNINLKNLETKKWNHLSFNFIASNSYNYNFRPAYFYESNEIFVDDIMLIDLTETFGAGNEPDQEWCNTHIIYFNGTTKIYK